MKVTYHTNNSGGSWWLKDIDWLALERAGWYVMWGGTQSCNEEGTLQVPPLHKWGDRCPGHRAFQSFKDLKNAGDDSRFLGAAAVQASKDFSSPGEAMREFERVTGRTVTDEGCHCCGAPHQFVWGEGADTGVVSGERCEEFLLADKKVPKKPRKAGSNRRVGGRG